MDLLEDRLPGQCYQIIIPWPFRVTSARKLFRQGSHVN